MAKLSRKERHRLLLQKIKENPFITDEELAEEFGCSVQTIRLDRAILDIKEVRERIKEMAKESLGKLKTISPRDVVGEIIDIELGSYAIATFEPELWMTFSNSQMVKGQHIYAFAESIAMSVIDAKAALIGIANIKYKTPVFANDRLVARAELKKKRNNKYIVWVFIKRNNEEVFRGKFILVAIDDENKETGQTGV
ncbi:transcription factor FapR [Caldicellulosiruptor changbaiensis]|uniref:Regulatory protein, DeoR n=2 Tax=Caldicellulosiruptor TaxID=44000 RepID=A4XJV8_CALS8|nr:MULTISPECIES: transcription factor FapR [Caldicellulosiruptor]ABP67193.1 regulatory protein, DeoR [Caldicellulosiruptor saccharolyticus DSM 8903]AZT90667.1 transcription factor FapR [Caldicellulosiruptor changbaiensis]